MGIDEFNGALWVQGIDAGRRRRCTVQHCTYQRTTQLLLLRTATARLDHKDGFLEHLCGPFAANSMTSDHRHHRSQLPRHYTCRQQWSSCAPYQWQSSPAEHTSTRDTDIHGHKEILIYRSISILPGACTDSIILFHFKPLLLTLTWDLIN